MRRSAPSLFSRNYAEARQAFLATAEARGLPIDSYILDLPGSEEKPWPRMWCWMARKMRRT